MAFREMLQQVVERVEGGLACILMGVDGLAIDSFYLNGSAPSTDIEAMAVEYTQLMKQMHHVAERSATGDVQEFLLVSEHITAIFRFLSEDFFLMLALTPEGNTGKGRYLLRILSPQLIQELM